MSGKTLTAGGTVTTIRACPQIKFGNGRDFPNAPMQALFRASDFNITGDLSATAVCDLDTLPASGTGRALVSMRDAAASITQLQMDVTNDGAIPTPVIAFRIFQTGTTPSVFVANVAATTGYHTYTVRRNDTAKTLVVVMDGNEGSPIINATYTGSVTSGAGGLYIGATSTSDTNTWDGGIYDLRFWNSLKSQSTLTAIVTPTGKCKPEGTEYAFYRLKATP